MDAKYEKVYPSQGLPFCFQKRIGRRLYFNWHYHHEYEITLIIQGRGQLFIGGSVVNYEKSNMVLIGPDVPHAFASNLDLPDSEYKSVIIQFTRRWIGLEHPSRTDFFPVYRLFQNAGGCIRFSEVTTKAVMEIIKPLEEDSGLPGLIDFLRIIDLISRDHNIQLLWSDSESGGSPPGELSKIEKMRQFVFQHYYEDISLSDAAGAANLSVPSLCRLCRKKMNTTFVKYLNSVRISAACKYLIQTDMPINSICFRVGFNNLSNFNRRFLNEKRQTPRQYRKQYQHEKLFYSDTAAAIAATGRG